MIGPAVIAVYCACMCPRTTATCAAMLLAVYGYCLRTGLVDASLFTRGANTVAITYAGMVAMVYAEMLINALKDLLIRRIKRNDHDDS